MNFIEEFCEIHTLSEEILPGFETFTCGDEDLDGFFREDAIKYAEHLLGKTYCIVLTKNPKDIVCAFTLSNESLRTDILPNGRKKKINENIPREKQMRRYPAALIGRLGVNTKYADKGIGSSLLRMLKQLLIDGDNLTACRYLAVDSYNNQRTLNFYERNGFKFLFSTEEQEAKTIGLSQPLNTRYMYFDLIDLK